MLTVKDFLRCGAAVVAFCAALALTGSTHALRATETTATCATNQSSLCVATDGSMSGQEPPHNQMCTGGSCVTCVNNGGRCAPFGSGVNVEGYWVGDP